MLAERFGSYSIDATVAVMPALSRLKSMMRILRLCPPPRCQIVWSPLLRRPPEPFFGSVNGLCGRFVVSSSLTSAVLKRNVGVTGLNVLIAIFFSSRSGGYLFAFPARLRLATRERYQLNRFELRTKRSLRTLASSRPP